MSLVADLPKGDYIKGSLFEEPQTVKFVSVSRVTANNPKYGDDSGMTNRYTLEIDGEERTFDNTSIRLVGAIDDAGIEAGDMGIMRRSGQGTDTMWEVTKLGKEV